MDSGPVPLKVSSSTQKAQGKLNQTLNPKILQDIRDLTRYHLATWTLRARALGEEFGVVGHGKHSCTQDPNVKHKCHSRRHTPLFELGCRI